MTIVPDFNYHNVGRKVSVGFYGDDIDVSAFEEGMHVTVEYDGIVYESYPSQIRAYHVREGYR